MDTSITNQSNPAVGGAGLESWAPKKAAAPTQLSNKETFLQLLVAQIKNQNPMNPQDGVEFLTQLTQFSSLEQMMSMRQELEAIRKAVVEPPAQTGASNGATEGGQ